MPELPDVENYRRYLDATALHQRVRHVEVGSAKIVRGMSGASLARRLTSRRLTRTRRHGKQLFAALDDGNWLTLHFGMTGRLVYFSRLDDDPRHDRLRLDFTNRYHLAFVNQRLLGKVGLTADPDDFIARHDLGPDALDPALDAAAFRALVGRRGGELKAALMDQSFLAGIGNVYADEILFQARLHPAARMRSLDRKQTDGLYRAMRRTLTTAIERGAGAPDLADRLPRGYLLGNRTEGARCPRCGGTIRQLKVAGRSTYVCPACQRCRS